MIKFILGILAGGLLVTFIICCLINNREDK